MRTVVDAIADQDGGAGTLTVLDDGAGPALPVPWREVHERARRMSAVLADGGSGPGKRIGLIGDTSVDLVAALQAVWLTGAAVTVLPPASRTEHLCSVVTDAGLDLLLVDTPPDLGPAARVPVLELSTVVRRAASRAPAAPHRPRRTDLAVLQYTSGSTRVPRGVPVTHGHLAANLDAIRTAIRHDAADPYRMLSWLPLYHDMGLIAFVCLPMSCGSPLVLQSPAGFARRPITWLTAMSRHRITMSGAPNFAYALMTRLLTAGVEVDLSSLRCLVSGGEPIDAAMMARFVAAASAHGLDPAALLPAYGLAESTLAATVSPLGAGVRVDRVDPDALAATGRAVPAAPARAARELVRVGRPVRGTALRVVDPRTGEPVGPRTVGHLELRGPSVVGHYWGDPPPGPGAWLRTGDLGYLTGAGADGELVVCGRIKDVLFAAGRNVFPQDVETAAAEVPGVRPGGAAAFGIPGDNGDRLVVAVESRDVDHAAVRRQVATAVLDEVGLNPADVVTVPPGRLPKTSSGKLRRAEARRRYLTGELATHRRIPERTVR